MKLYNLFQDKQRLLNHWFRKRKSSWRLVKFWKIRRNFFFFHWPNIALKFSTDTSFEWNAWQFAPFKKVVSRAFAQWAVRRRTRSSIKHYERNTSNKIYGLSTTIPRYQSNTLISLDRGCGKNERLRTILVSHDGDYKIKYRKLGMRWYAVLAGFQKFVDRSIRNTVNCGNVIYGCVRFLVACFFYFFIFYARSVTIKCVFGRYNGNAENM